MEDTATGEQCGELPRILEGSWHSYRDAAQRLGRGIIEYSDFQGGGGIFHEPALGKEKNK